MKICCINIKDLPAHIVRLNGSRRENIFKQIDESKILWLERADIEHDPQYKQLISYAIVIRDDGKIACYPRHGSEKRLHGMYSCGVGGHVDEPDCKNSLEATIITGLKRELSEEFQDFDFEKVDINYLGFLNETESEAGLVHTGIVFECRCSAGYLPTPAAELLGLEWKTKEELTQLKTELWSKLALDLI